MSKHPLVTSVQKQPLAFSFQKPLDMTPRGPKVLTEIVPTWSPEHAEVVKRNREAREAARKRYGRS